MYAVIMAGGGGTRLWPLSRQSRPKPFLPLVEGRSLLQATVARLQPLVGPQDVYVVTDDRYAGFARELLPDLPAANVLREPLGRNTAAAVALAAVAVDRPADEVMLVLPADHRIRDEAGFRAALGAAAARAGRGDLVTLGVEPDGPETGYGYVLATGSPEAVAGRPTYQVERFVEKPTLERARELIAGGRASWNAGIFVWRRDAVLAGLERHAADILRPIREALGGKGGAAALEAVYRSVRATSIDYALLEPASLEAHVAVVPIDVGWSDVGSWAALQAVLAESAGPDGVVRQAQGAAEVIAIGARDVLVHAAGERLVVVLGLHDAIVVDTPDAVLVCSADAAQEVRRVVDRLTEDGRSEHL